VRNQNLGRRETHLKHRNVQDLEFSFAPTQPGKAPGTSFSKLGSIKNQVSGKVAHNTDGPRRDLPCRRSVKQADPHPGLVERTNPR
jgi:hypothetical protein